MIEIVNRSRSPVAPVIVWKNHQTIVGGRSDPSSTIILGNKQAKTGKGWTLKW